MERDRDTYQDEARRRSRAIDDQGGNARERYGNEEDEYSRDYRRAYGEQDLARRLRDDRAYNRPGYEPEVGRPGGREVSDLDRGRSSERDRGYDEQSGPWSRDQGEGRRYDQNQGEGRRYDRDQGARDAYQRTQREGGRDERGQVDRSRSEGRFDDARSRSESRDSGGYDDASGRRQQGGNERSQTMRRPDADDDWQGGFYGQGRRFSPGAGFGRQEDESYGPPMGQDQQHRASSQREQRQRSGSGQYNPFDRPSSPYDQGDMSSWYGGDTGMGDSGSSMDRPRSSSQPGNDASFGREQRGAFGSSGAGYVASHDQNPYRQMHEYQSSGREQQYGGASTSGRMGSGSQSFGGRQEAAGQSAGNRPGQGFGGHGFGSQSSGGQSFGGQSSGFNRDWRSDQQSGFGEQSSFGERGQSGRGEHHQGRSGYEPGPFTGHGPRSYQRSDERVREDVCELLTQHGEIDATSMEVDVHQGVVTLRGIADSGRVRRLTEEVVEQVPGVRDVENQLRVNQRTGYGDVYTETQRQHGGTGQHGEHTGQHGTTNQQGGAGQHIGQHQGQGSQTSGQHQQAGQGTSGVQTSGTPAYGVGVAETSGVSTRTGAGEPGVSAGGGPSQHGNRWQIRETMEVVGSDGERVGSVKTVRGTDFLVDRSLGRDVYAPFSAVQTVDGDRVMLSCRASEVDQQNWPQPSLTGGA